MARQRTKPQPERTVELELWLKWNENKRKKDAVRIAVKIAEKNAENIKKAVAAGKDPKEVEKIPGSKPTIEKALLYGHCNDDLLRDFITTYFEERKALESVQGAVL